MIALLADENFDNDILRALEGMRPDLHIVRAQDRGLQGLSDADLLEWAAKRGYVLLTHDKQTLIRYAFERVKSGLSMPGVVEVKLYASIKSVLSDLVLLIEATRDDEWEGQIKYIPIA